MTPPIDKVDKRGNRIHLGDMVIYSGPNVGLILGVVVKLNPMTYKVKYQWTRPWSNEVVDDYVNVSYQVKSALLVKKSVLEFDPLSILTDVEKRRIMEDF